MAIKEAQEHSPISEERRIETERYGRNVLYKKLCDLLPDKQREAFQLVNVSIADLDDLIDETGKHDILPKAIRILTDAFAGEQMTELAEPWQKDIARLGTILKDLEQDGFLVARNIYEETINFWLADGRDRERQGIVSDQATLDQFNADIGRTVAMQFLLFFYPALPKENLNSLAHKYGLAVKTADNLSDLEKDLRKGFVNISRESLTQFGLRVERSNEGLTIKSDMHPYAIAELLRIEKLYESAQQCLEEVEEYHSNTSTALILLRDVFTSWLEEARAKVGSVDPGPHA